MCVHVTVAENTRNTFPASLSLSPPLFVLDADSAAQRTDKDLVVLRVAAKE